jgi:hypothetical protein
VHRLIPLEPIVVTPSEIAARTAIGDQFLAETLATGETLYAEA